MKEPGPPEGIFREGEAYYAQLYRQYFPRLFNYARQFTRDEALAEDLVQEVFLKLWESVEEVDGDRIGGLLFRMTRNLCLNHIQHLKVVQNAESDLKELGRWEELYRIEFIRDEPCLLIEQEMDQRMQGIMAGLSGRCREVFRMSRIDGLKNRQIAEKLGISTKTVEKHIRQALIAFRKGLTLLVPLLLILLAPCYP